MDEGVGCGVLVALAGATVSCGRLVAVKYFSVGVMPFVGKKVSSRVAEPAGGALKESASIGRQALSSKAAHKPADRGRRIIFLIWRVSRCTVGDK